MVDTNSTTGVSAGQFQWDSDEFQDGNIGLRLVFKTESASAVCTVELIKVGETPSLLKTMTTTSTDFVMVTEELDLNSGGNGIYEVRVYTTNSSFFVILASAELVIS